MTREDLAITVSTAYMDAVYKNSDKGWKAYRRKLNKLAQENDASSPQALEDWALDFIRNYGGK